MVPSPALRATTPSLAEATFVFAIFLVVQVLDGVLTYVGVRMLGVEAEGNMLLAAGMEAFGTPQTLFSAKLVACVCGYVLYRTAWYRPLAVAAGLYLGVAIVPWLGIMVRLFIAP